MQKELLHDLLVQNQVTCGYAFNQLSTDDISLRLNDKTASAGFIFRHLGETMNMFGHFFGVPTDVQNTTMGKTDEGQGKSVEESRHLVEQGFIMLNTLIDQTPDEGWLELINTPFFGAVSKAKLFAHVLYHNAYHAGQIGLTLKKGQ